MSDTSDMSSDTAWRLHWIKQRYGDRLTPAELEDVRKGIDGIMTATAALRKVKLDNSDEPFSVFVPYRHEG
jgi:hypothetical protein